MITTDQNILRDLFHHADRKIEIKENKKNFYVKDEVLKAETVKCKKSGEISSELAIMFRKLAYRVSFMPAFRYDTEDDRNDCIQHAVLQMMTSGIDKYDEFRKTKDGKLINTFSYFTEVAMNGLRAGWNEIKKHSNRTERIDLIFEENI